MGRRRRKVVRVLKKRLPRFWDCPRCVARQSVSIKIEDIKSTITVNCSECGEGVGRYVDMGQKVDFKCPTCDKEIVTMSIQSSDTIRITCKRCGITNFLPIREGEKTQFYCKCDQSRQGTFLISLGKRFASAHCGSCGVKDHFEARKIDSPVDIYGTFSDRYHGQYKPRPPVKVSSFLDELRKRNEIKPSSTEKEVPSIAIMKHEDKEVFERLYNEEKKRRELKRELKSY